LNLPRWIKFSETPHTTLTRQKMGRTAFRKRGLKEKKAEKWTYDRQEKKKDDHWMKGGELGVSLAREKTAIVFRTKGLERNKKGERVTKWSPGVQPRKSGVVKAGH